MFASCAVSSHDLRRSSNRVLTITTDVSSVAVTGRPLLGSTWMLTRPSRKRDAHRDTVLRSTTLSPQTSCKALWLSFGFFPCKVSILMYDRWSLCEIWLQSVSSCRTWTTYPANTHTAFFTEVWLTTVAKIRTIATSYWPRKRSAQNFWNDLRIIVIIIIKDVSCHRLFLPGTSLEPEAIPTAQASSFTLQYFPYYVWCSRYSCLL
jgi:hypothetical protein